MENKNNKIVYITLGVAFVVIIILNMILWPFILKSPEVVKTSTMVVDDVPQVESTESDIEVLEPVSEPEEVAVVDIIQDDDIVPDTWTDGLGVEQEPLTTEPPMRIAEGVSLEGIPDTHKYFIANCWSIYMKDQEPVTWPKVPLEAYVRDLRYDVTECYVTIGFENTDCTVVFTISLHEEYNIEWWSDFGNRFGTDYPVVYFTNGVPSNSKEIYEKMYEELELFPYGCFSDYKEGDTIFRMTYDGGEYSTNIS